MTNYRAILNYYQKGNTTTQIATLCECSRTTVLKTIKRAKECGLELPVDSSISDMKLLKILYPKRVHREGYAQPDFYELEKDKKRRKLTIYVMWRRYYKRTLAAGGKPYKKSQFFKLFQRYKDIYNSRFRFGSTPTMTKAYSFFWDTTYFTTSNRILTKSEAWEKLVLWCKKMRLNPDRL